MATYILTLRLDEPSQAYFDSLRRRHYPPKLNQIAAHLTLFHTLPDAPHTEAAITAIATQQSRLQLKVSGLRSLGKGVAYTVSAPGLLTLHHALADAFADHLTPQDRQRFMPHVVVQNKATPEAARMLLAELQREFVPFEAQAYGLDLWEYHGGPWRHAAFFEFQHS